jgi:hypothetical protein
MDDPLIELHIKGSIRDEYLNSHWFLSLDVVREECIFSHRQNINIVGAAP